MPGNKMKKDEKKADVYETVRRILDEFPMGAPKTNEIYELLKEILTQEEAEIFAQLSTMPSRPNYQELADKLGSPVEEVHLVLEEMAKRGVISSRLNKNGTEVFSIVPFMPGMLEYIFAGGPDNNTRRRLADILKHYLDKGYIHEVHSSNYPFMRVIPIQKNIDASSTILPFEQVGYILEKARSIAVINCACRSIENKCAAPIETCIMLDGAADHLIKYRNAKRLSLGESLNLLQETDDYGLVHMTINAQTGSSGICSCCTCCCMLLRGLVEYNNPRAFVRANFMPDINHSKCSKCTKCIDICPVGAMFLYLGHGGNKLEKKVTIISERCIGCGLCASHCPNDAISLKKVREYVPEKTLGSAWGRFKREKVY
jgi:Na+-translocating ferredoxin:NAD+ oxidoreductase subunit B